MFWGLACRTGTTHVRSVVSDSLRPRGLQPARLLCQWDFPGKDTGVGGHFLLQGTFPTQGWSPRLAGRGFFPTTATLEPDFKFSRHNPRPLPRES